MITDREAVMQILLLVEPAYKADYQRNLEKRKRPPTTSGDITAFSQFVGDRLREGNYQNASKVFDAVESLLDESASSGPVKDALCTCFLENLLNSFTVHPEILSTFIPLLGPRSRAYCRAWDEFTGVKTPGLYDES